MKVYPPLFCRAFAIVGFATMPLLPADPEPTFDLKAHAGFTAGQLRMDQQDNKLFGFGVAGRFPLGATKALTVELDFDYMPGRDHDALPSSGATFFNPQNPATSYAGIPLHLSPSTSIDWRKEYRQGFSLKGGYTDKLSLIENSYWFAGLSLDVYKTKTQLTGTLTPVWFDSTPGVDSDGNATGQPKGDTPIKLNGKDYYEGWAFVAEKTKVGLGAFAGVGVPINEFCGFEFTVRNIGYLHQDYRPFTYTGRPAELREVNHRGFTFEFGLSLKL